MKKEPLSFTNVLSNKYLLFNLILSQINCSSHERKHLIDVIMNIKDNFSISNLISNLASNSNPYIHLPTEIMIIEGLISKLIELSEIDFIFSKSVKKFSINEFLENDDFIIIDLSFIPHSKVKNFISLMILSEISFSYNPIPYYYLIVESPEGFSIFSVTEFNFISEILDKLILNDIYYCFTANYHELNEKILSKFETVFIFNFNNSSKILKAISNNFSNELIILNKGNEITIKKLDLDEHLFTTLEKFVPFKPKEIKKKSLLENIYGNLSEVISNLILDIEKNIVTRKEIQNLLFSYGYFSKNIDELIDKLISEKILEEKIIGGVKRIFPTSKGLFLAKEHKIRSNE